MRTTLSRMACIVAVGAIGLLYGMGDAAAQDIQRYGEGTGGNSSSSGGSSSEGGGGMVYPGQPMPESDQSTKGNTRRVRQKKKGKGEQKGGAASYAIRIHEPGDLGEKEAPNETDEGVLSKPPEKLYRGVIPGTRNSVDHLPSDGEAADGQNRLTWLGFQPKEKTSRIFIQTSQTPNYSKTMESDGTILSIRLDDTTLSAENFRRSIDTSAFDRVVRNIEAREDDGATVVKIRLRESASPSFEVSDNYLYIDFPHEPDEDDTSADGQV